MRWVSVLLILLSAIALTTIRVLVIYASEYEDETIVDLPLAKADAERFADFFEEIPGALVEIVPNTTYAEFLREFKRFVRSLKKDDVAVIFYAGHGMGMDGKFYFIPVDADPEDSETWVSFEKLELYVQNWMRIFWFIDACYSGAVMKGRPLRVIRVSRSGFDDLRRSVVFTSASENEISREFEGGGIFTRALIEGLSGSADMDGDGWIETGEIYGYIRRRVEELSGGKQHPMMIGPEDLKLIPNVSKKLDELEKIASKLRERGGLNKGEFENVLALIKGRECPGAAAKELRRVFEEFILRRIEGNEVEKAMRRLGKSLNCGARPNEIPYIPHGSALLVIVPKGDALEGARIYIDGKFAGTLGRDPFRIRVPEGIHRVDVRSDLAEDVSFEFEVGKGGKFVKELSGRRAKRSVRIESVPSGAEVILEGESVGRTPVTVELDVGRSYRLTLIKEGYERFEGKLEVEEKGPEMVVSFTLERLTAELTVLSTPSGARVFLNGEFLGLTPLNLKRSEIRGTLRVETNVSSSEREVEVKPGESRILAFDLRRTKLRITTEPEGADVLLDGRSVGRTPISIILNPGETHVLILKKVGYISKRVLLRTREGEMTLFEKLEKVSVPLTIWKKVYGGNGWDSAVKVLKKNSHFIIVGYSNSKDGDIVESEGFEDVFAILIDGNGKVLKKFHYGSPFGDVVRDVEECGNGYVIVGERRVWSSSRPFIAMVDESFGVIWEKEFEGDGNAGALGVACSGGKIAVVGYTRSHGGSLTMRGGWEDAFFILLSRSGKVLKRVVMGGGGEDRLSSILKTSGGFVAVGYSSSSRGMFSENKGWRDGWVVFFDESGDISRNILVGGGGGDVLSDVVKIDGRFVAVGYTDSLDLGAEGRDVLVVEFDENGRLSWMRTFGGSGSDEALGVTAVENGILVLGRSDSRDWLKNRGGYDAFAMQIDESGELLWVKSFGGVGDDEMRDALEIDGRIIMVGTEFSQDGKKRWGNYLVVEVGM